MPASSKPRLVSRSLLAEARRSVIEGRIVDVVSDEEVTLETQTGRRIACRCPLHVSAEWLRSALRLGPVEAEASISPSGREATLWCVLPTPEQRHLVPDTVTIEAESKVSIVCGKSRLTLSRGGTIRVRGRDVATRGSHVARLQGGTVRLN
jgi:hypothetical protein